MNLIPLVPVPGHLATSYGRSGKTRDPSGNVWDYDRLIRVEQSSSSSKAEVWTCTPAMARDLEALDDAMKFRGSRGLRLTEVRRSFDLQQRERAKYDRWVAAGKPDPGEKGWNKETMRTTFVAKAGESNHQWGAAVDFDVYALDFPDVDADHQLSVLWDLADDLGFRPIITEPDRGMSECWHFDHVGPLRKVYDLFRADKALRPSAYPLTAMVGCLLTGVYKGSLSMERLVQARLLLAGQAIGKPDGAIGRNTLAGLRAVGISDANLGAPASRLIGLLDELEVAKAELEAA